MVVLWLVCGQQRWQYQSGWPKGGSIGLRQGSLLSVPWRKSERRRRYTRQVRYTTEYTFYDIIIFSYTQRLEQKPDVCPKPRFAPVLDMRQGSHCSDLRASLFDDVTVKLMLFRVCVCVYILIVLLHCGASISFGDRA